jgi:ribonuclease Z
MRQPLEPSLVNDAFGDPGRYVDFNDERRALLFDLGDLTVLPPRKLLRVSHVFVSHTHMDHFAGFDQLLRVVLGRKDSIVLVLDVREVAADRRGQRARISSRTRFTREDGASFECAGDGLYDEALFVCGPFRRP